MLTPDSFAERLECSVCGELHMLDLPQNLSTCHGRPLLVRYDLEGARERIDGTDTRRLFGRQPHLWRYAPLLPASDAAGPVTLGEGWTPTLEAPRLADACDFAGRLLLKDEGKNPTGSFKARGMTAAVTVAKRLGLTHLSVPTAGNAGGALALYAARGGLRATVAMPRDAPEANKAEVRLAAAELIEVDGLINDCGALLKERAARTQAFDVSTLKEPYRLEGKKTMGYELWEQLDGVLPDVVVYPTGGGTGLVGMWKAFDELETLGLIDSERPRMVTVQAEGCAPIVRALREGAEEAVPWEDAHTIAGGLRVPVAIGDRLILSALRDSTGTALAVSDDSIRLGMQLLARTEGVLACENAAATVAGLQGLVADDLVDRNETVCLFVTGSGLKSL